MTQPVRDRTREMAPPKARWPGQALGVARPPPLIDRLLRADSIAFLLCVSMTLGSAFVTVYWLLAPA